MVNICPNCRSVEHSMCSEGVEVFQKSRESMASSSLPISSSSSPSFFESFKYFSTSELNLGVNLGTKCLCETNPEFYNYFSQQIYFHALVSKTRRKFASLHHSGLSSGYLTLFAVFAAFLLFLPTVMSSPVPGSSGSGEHHRHHKEKNRIHERPAKWINPCRIPSNVPTTYAETDLQTTADKDIFHHIITQATKAEIQAKTFEKEFYKEAFGEDTYKFEDLYYDWLNDIMEVVNGDFNEDLPVEDTIKTVYMGLQKFAVGLEAIVLDQACYGGSFYQLFNEAEFQLKYVLCELQIAMLEKNIQYEDITRDIMAQEFRDMPDRATRNIRDWTIFRDYVKTLKFVQKAFRKYFERAEISEALKTNGADLLS